MQSTKQLESIQKVLATLAFLLIVIIGTQQIAQDLIAPILLACFIMVLLFPVYKWFRGKGLSTSLSVLFMSITFFVGLSLVVVFITWSFSLMADSISLYVSGVKDAITQSAENLPIDTAVAETAANSINPNAIAGLLRSVSGSLGSIFMYLIFVPILAVLMLVQIDSIPQSTMESMSEGNKNFTRFKKFGESIITYLSGRLKVNLVTGILFTLVLFIMGVDYPLVWGLLTVIMSFIPYIGLVIAGTPPTLIAFAENGIGGALLVVISIILINFFAENILDPYVQGKGTKISTAAIVVALVFWTWLLGPIGALLSVPLTVSIKIVLADYQETHWLALLMEGNYETAHSEAQKTTELDKIKSKLASFTTGFKKNK